MSLSRRAFLERCAALGLTAAVFPTLGCQGAPSDEGDTDDLPDDGLPRYTWDGDPGPETTFSHAVASGDPLTDAVLLWTRVTPGDGVTGDVEVFLEVALSPDFRTRVAAGPFVAKAAADRTVTVDQTGLEPGTTYYFRFHALGRTSPVGRTRTAPEDGVQRFRFGVVSCSNLGFGYLHAYRHLAARADVDLVVHLGDYIYEYAMDGYGAVFGTYRPLDPPWECVTLEDYRRRYAHYRADADLQEVHRQHPFVVVWDDHEFANNPKVGGAGNHTEGEEGAWTDRVAAALQAYGEWLPVRLREGGRIFRELVFGDLAHLLVVDRQRRFLWPEPDDGARYLGAEQTAWLLDRLDGVSAQWTVLCTATSFTSRKADGSDGGSFDGSAWDGASRREVLDAVAEAGLENLVVVVGDIHKAQALDVAHDPTAYDPETGAGSEGVEFACGSVGSPGTPSGTGGAPHFFFTDGGTRGYLLVDLTPERLTGEFWGYPDDAKISPELPAEALFAAFTSETGSHHLVATDTPTTPDADAPALAP